MTRIKRAAKWMTGTVEFTRGIVLWLVLSIVRDGWDNAAFSNIVFAIQLVVISLLFYGISMQNNTLPRTKWFKWIMLGAVFLGAGSALLVFHLTS